MKTTFYINVALLLSILFQVYYSSYRLRGFIILVSGIFKNLAGQYNFSAAAGLAELGSSKTADSELTFVFFFLKSVSTVYGKLNKRQGMARSEKINISLIETHSKPDKFKIKIEILAFLSTRLFF